MYDLIGDIHGHADALEQLLRTLGYSRGKGAYRHPERQVIFLGDFIDRGPKIRETLEIVRPMVDSGAALSVMGNHELNALAFHTPDPTTPGSHLRPHNEKNSRQHAETMRQIPSGELSSYLEWFGTLPLWLELDGLRVVKVLGCVNSTLDFTDQHLVINGCSDLLHQIFGKEGNGFHARSALGFAQLPTGAAVEVEAIFEVRD